MTLHSLTPRAHARAGLTPRAHALAGTVTALILLLPVTMAPAPALAGHRHAPSVGGVPITYDTFRSAEPDHTGSLSSTFVPSLPGRSTRSSTLGNADFPERDPTGQNLGTTAGGGLN